MAARDLDSFNLRLYRKYSCFKLFCIHVPWLALYQDCSKKLICENIARKGMVIVPVGLCRKTLTIFLPETTRTRALIFGLSIALYQDFSKKKQHGSIRANIWAKLCCYIMLETDKLLYGAPLPHPRVVCVQWYNLSPVPLLFLYLCHVWYVDISVFFLVLQLICNMLKTCKGHIVLVM